MFTEFKCLLGDADTGFGQLGSIIFPFCFPLESGIVFAPGENGVLLVVFICQLLLLIDVIVSLLIFT